MTAIAVYGAGAFGTALAVALSRDGTPVTLVGRTHAEAIASARENVRRLPGVRLPDSLAVASTCPLEAEIVLLAIPMQALRPSLPGLRGLLDGRRLVACCKGIDLETGRGPTTLLREACPRAVVAMLTGPSFAADIGRGLPTALTLACADRAEGLALQEKLSREPLRLYFSPDVVGAELGGALKNVVALAAGITIGAGLGESARASVVTRGFAEMQRIALQFGAEAGTLTGLSGLGDLVLTCTSEKSRNFSAGLRLGRGETPEPGQTVEGIATAEAVDRLARDRGFDAPLAAMVAAVAGGRLDAKQARDILLARPLRNE